MYLCVFVFIKNGKKNIKCTDNAVLVHLDFPFLQIICPFLPFDPDVSLGFLCANT